MILLFLFGVCFSWCSGVAWAAGSALVSTLGHFMQWRSATRVTKWSQHPKSSAKSSRYVSRPMRLSTGGRRSVCTWLSYLAVDYVNIWVRKDSQLIILQNLPFNRPLTTTSPSPCRVLRIENICFGWREASIKAWTTSRRTRLSWPGPKTLDKARTFSGFRWGPHAQDRLM